MFFKSVLKGYLNIKERLKNLVDMTMIECKFFEILNDVEVYEVNVKSCLCIDQIGLNFGDYSKIFLVYYCYCRL